MKNKEFNLSEIFKKKKIVLAEDKYLPLEIQNIIFMHLNSFEGDVKEFIKIVEEIVTKRCMGTSANCYEIKKEIRLNAGKDLIGGDDENKKI